MNNTTIEVKGWVTMVTLSPTNLKFPAKSACPRAVADGSGDSIEVREKSCFLARGDEGEGGVEGGEGEEGGRGVRGGGWGGGRVHLHRQPHFTTR